MSDAAKVEEKPQAVEAQHDLEKFCGVYSNYAQHFYRWVVVQKCNQSNGEPGLKILDHRLQTKEQPYEVNVCYLKPHKKTTSCDISTTWVRSKFQAQNHEEGANEPESDDDALYHVVFEIREGKQCLAWTADGEVENKTRWEKREEKDMKPGDASSGILELSPNPWLVNLTEATSTSPH